MSRGQKPRTPEYFPRMKHRAAGRLAQNEARASLPNLLDAISQWSAGFAATVRPLVDAIMAVGRNVAALLGQHFRVRHGMLYAHDDIAERWVVKMVRDPEGLWWPVLPSLWHTVDDEAIARLGEAEAFDAALRVAKARTFARLGDPWHVDYGAPGIMRVPHVDADIVADVDAMRPSSLGQRVAIERTLQDRRDGRA